jgi:alpha-L-glutamate ligase-like protein
MIGLARRLKAAGVLGLNWRNAEYILPYNPRRLYPLVDDKVQTKTLAIAAGLAVPELYGIIHVQREVRDLHRIIEGRDAFVIKPAQGSGGEGILVLERGPKGLYRKPGGSFMTEEELGYHTGNILSGIYSLGGQPDKALIEYRVNFDPVFARIAHQGVPDIRIISFLGVPAMAMVRLPTRQSGGKANLHQGAIGAGIDLATGRTLTAVWGNGVIDIHPDTLNPVTGIEIPHWPLLLEHAARSYELTGLGYQGIDIVLDRDLGPLILELNARPGLNIQIANRAGLAPRLEKIKKMRDSLKTIEERIAFARENFAA